MFCPLFRLHGFREPRTEFGVGQTGGPNEVWSFGAEAFGCIKDMLLLRERLRPYVMDQMRVAHAEGLPPMRPVFVDFPGDAAAWDRDGEFMLGPSLLIVPVTRYRDRERRVYLPAGSSWTDPWTGEVSEGGATLTVAAPLDRIPVFLRDGARLPIAGPAAKDR